MHKFKQYLFVGASLLLMSSGVLSAENKQNLPFLLAELKIGSTLPTATEPQSKQATHAISGFWLSSVAQEKLFSSTTDAKKQILAFSTNNSALIKVGPPSSLASYKIKGYRATSLSFVAERLLIRKAQLLEKQNDQAVTESYKKRRVYPLQKMIDRFIVITKDAQEAGYKQAKEIALKIETRNGFFKVERQTLRLLLIGGGLYLADGITYTPFYRQAVLWNELAKEKPVIWAKFNIPLQSAWRQINPICTRMDNNNLPAEECWAFRNRATELGAVLPPVPVKASSRQVAKRGPVELHLKKYMSSLKFGSGSHRQLLDYCYDSNNGRSGKLFYRQLKARGYRNTLWSLTLSTESIEEKPSNWSKQEYREMGKSLYLRNKIFLREDGVLGLTQEPEGRMIFDVRNKWVLEEKQLSISLDNDQVMLSFTLNRGAGLNFSSNIKPAPITSSLSLISGNYVLYSSEIPYDHPQRVLLTKAQISRNCNSNIYVAGVTPESLAPLPEVTWPSREKGSFPSHWHIRRVSIYHENSGKTPTPLEIEQGSFFYLRESGDIGRSIEHPANYDFSINGRWRIDGSSMQWKLGETEINFESTEGFTQGILSELLTNPRSRYFIFPTDLLAGAMADPEPKTVPAPALASIPAPAKVAVPVPTSVEPAADIAPILGCWYWSNGGRIVFQADGSVTNGPVHTTWKESHTARQYSVVWPPIEDKIKLGKDQSTYTGTGIFNIPFSGRRQGSGQGLPGRWLRNDGLVLDIAADGSVAAGPLRGSWRSEAENSYTVTWPVVDKLILSADGSSLQVSNQFGKVTAMKQKSISGCR